MKKQLLFLFSFVVMNTSLFAQTNINLVLNHKVNDQVFSYDSVFEDDQGRAVKISRLQYFMSTISLTHDGGLNSPLTDVYVLANANVSNYNLGEFNIENVEAINFDLGVDYYANHANSSNFPAAHPLGPKSPPMDWGWPSGYFFIVIDGKVDDNNDGTPNKWFQMHGIGDVLLQDVQVDLVANAFDDELIIAMDVNIEQWLNGVDLVEVGFEHSSNEPLPSIMSNSVDNEVFIAQEYVGIEEVEQINSISMDYTLAYAPTINYQFSNKSNFQLNITDLKGTTVLKENEMGFEGNYFITKELPTGIYIANFYSQNISYTHKFVVQH